MKDAGKRAPKYVQELRRMVVSDEEREGGPIGATQMMGESPPWGTLLEDHACMFCCSVTGNEKCD
jgi:hypothetical protein